jgi:hypothetical protein
VNSDEDYPLRSNPGGAHPGDDGEVRVQLLDDVRGVFQKTASITSPDLSLFFIAFFVLLAYFHETHQAYTAIVLGAWLLIQLGSFVVKDDFRNDLFWSIFSLIGNLLFYLFIGYLWSLAKLYLDVWQGHLPTELMSQIRVCVSTKGEPGCVLQFLFAMKWNIIRWMMAWPVSMAYTLSRDPLRIITDVIFDWSRQRYYVIITSALAAHDASTNATFNPADPSSVGAADWYILAWWSGSVTAYLVIGYAWTHLKLFVDVWQGTLPQSLDDEVRQVYQGDKNYWQFVVKIKWLVLTWLITWPLSIVYTLLRHPVRILAETIYKLSQRKYMWLVRKGMEARDSAQPN